MIKVCCILSVVCSQQSVVCWCPCEDGVGAVRGLLRVCWALLARRSIARARASASSLAVHLVAIQLENKEWGVYLDR